MRKYPQVILAGLLLAFITGGISFIAYDSTGSFDNSDAGGVNEVPLKTPNPGLGPAQSIVQQTPNENLVTLSNGAVSRTLKLTPEGISTTSIKNRLTATEYLKENGPEFRLRLSNDLEGQEDKAELDSSQFKLKNYSIDGNNQQARELKIELSGEFKDVPVLLNLYYEVESNNNFMRKRLVVAPFKAAGWIIREVVLEDWKAISEIEPLGVVKRYPELNPGTAQVNYSLGENPAEVDTTQPQKRFASSSFSEQAALQPGQGGFYFFTESIFGSEHFDGRLTLKNLDYIEPAKGFTSGKAVIGMWKGRNEIGLKRYNEFIYDHYAVIKGKKDPVWFSTWYVYEEHINQENLFQTLDYMKEAGFYDLLHIDAGWEKDAPLKVNLDSEKFPNGLEPVVEKLKENGLGLGLWMNPFSGFYEEITSYKPFREEHPDWVASNNTWLCPLSGAGEYVRERLVEIAKKWPLKVLYWDGMDFNLAGCDSAEHKGRNPAEERVLMLKYYASLLDELHQIRPDLRVMVWSAPPDIHWLSFVDQVQLSDIHETSLGESETIRRQQIYHASFIRPEPAIWGDWYGFQYHRDLLETQNQPLQLLEYAEVSQLGNGATQAGGSYSLENAPPELNLFNSQLFSFRKRFGDYFNTYQHILGFPDGKRVEGEAHFLGKSGLIILLNPADIEQKVNLPLTEPELEFPRDQTHLLTDWSSLETGSWLGVIKTPERFEVKIPAHGWRIIGVNLPQNLSLGRIGSN